MVLPEPLGPTMAVSSPAAKAMLDGLEHGARAPATDERANDERAHAASHAARDRRITRTRNGAPTSDVKTPSCSS